MKENIIHRRFFLKSVAASFASFSGYGSPLLNPGAPLRFTIRTGAALRQLSSSYCWFHPRVAAIPSGNQGQASSVIMTIQKHLRVSDYYSGVYYMHTGDMGKTWSGPHEIPELKMYTDSEGYNISVADVTPGWHEPTQKLLAIGIRVKYGKDGKQILDTPLSHNCAYTTFDPATGKWAAWKTLPPLPDGISKFYLVNPGCVQWLVKADGTILLPVYFSRKAEEDNAVTVLHCTFDGEHLSYVHHGTELVRQGGRGYVEPSLAFWNNRYYLTLRNDFGAYISTSTDVVTWSSPRPWVFDDGKDLGSYNTQAHWLVHREGLFLCYTRRGANNDHIPRNRAPIFIGQVDPERLCIMRATEQVLIPERGAMLGNFGAAFITAHESWVTDAEFMIGEQPHPRGADGTVWVSRVCWSKPNDRMIPE
jgi:hypothetical protein